MNAQVQQEKKTNKWKCTMCGAAQSGAVGCLVGREGFINFRALPVRKIYARGFTGDCRAVVQVNAVL